MRDKLKLYTYPDVPKDGLGNDEIVNVKTSYGSFTDAYSWELSEGDVYCQRTTLELPPRSKAQLFDYLVENALTLDWCRDDDWCLTELEVWKDAKLLVKYPFHKDLITTASDAINYIMDMDNQEL
jgi:hypothetical protein